MRESAAYEYWKRNAQEGHAVPQNILGIMYHDEVGVLQDNTEAVKWWRRAAEQGYDLAQFFLAYSYYKGRGVPKDYVSSYMWFSLATTFAPNNERRENHASFRDMVAEKMTLAQIAEAERLSREGGWRQRIIHER